VLSAEELKTGWLFPLRPRYHSLSTDCLWLSPSDQDDDPIITGSARKCYS